MLFTSTVFLLFLLVFVPVYFALPHRWRALWITAGSYYFYTYGHLEYWWLLFTCTIVAYLGGLAMERWPAVWPRRLALLLGVGVNVGLLVYFKYGELIARTWKTTMKAWHIKTKVHIPHLVLPIGISFFTFQALAYLFDVYRRRFPAERRLDIFAAYKSFFPQLVAGPIERPGNVIPQLHQEHRWDFDRAASGLRLMLWGFFKKLVIADHLAVAVREAYGSNSSSSLQLILGTYAFAWQIFCDFSAYTDIARGCARILGIELMENFRQPYFAKSIPEFWSRWHISLSTWFRDYLYIPLGGNRGGWFSWQRNLLIVFLVSGLWHGADWKFAVWGLLHAAFFLGANLFAKLPAPRRALPALAARRLEWAQDFRHLPARLHRVGFLPREIDRARPEDSRPHRASSAARPVLHAQLRPLGAALHRRRDRAARGGASLSRAPRLGRPVAGPRARSGCAGPRIMW